MYNTVGSDATIVISPLSSLGYQAKRASILKRSPKISGGDGGELNSPSKGSYPEYTTSLVSYLISPG